MTTEPSDVDTLHCVVMRGGTTRGFFFRADDLPSDPEQRDALLLSVIAGGGGCQADGMGGRDLLLSKVVLVRPSPRAEADLDVVYGAVTPGSHRIKYGSNCGNLAAAVGLYARDEGLIERDRAAVRIFNPDSGALLEARVESPGPDRLPIPMDPSMGPPTGTPVELAFIRPTGTLGGGLLPTGRPVDRLELPGGPIDVSVVDAGAVYVFLRAAEVGLDDPAGPLDSSGEREVLRIADQVRRRVAVMIGAAPDEELADVVTPNVPKVSFVSAAGPPSRGDGGARAGDGDHCRARIVSSQSLHRSYAVTGAIATAAAAVVPGSVVATVVGPVSQGEWTLRIGHPSGRIEPRITWTTGARGIVVERACLRRTARRLMEGALYSPRSARHEVAAELAYGAGAPTSAGVLEAAE